MPEITEEIKSKLTAEASCKCCKRYKVIKHEGVWICWYCNPLNKKEKFKCQVCPKN